MDYEKFIDVSGQYDKDEHTVNAIMAEFDKAANQSVNIVLYVL